MAAHGRSGPLTRVVALLRGSTVCHNISQSFKIIGFLTFIYFSYHL